MDTKATPDRLVLGPIYPELEAQERRRFLDAAAIAALPVCIRDMMYRPPMLDPESNEILFKCARFAWEVADVMLAERDRRRAEENA
jgi:hypothetical protein